MKQKVLEIKQIIVDEKYYPRVGANHFTAFQYSNAMKAGAKFPPIDVALIDNKYYLIDGNHRIHAHKLLKDKFISAIVDTNVNDFKTLYVEAVKKNATHGKQFTVQEKAKIINTLQKFNFKKEEIAPMIGVPEMKLDGFVKARMTNTLTGEEVFLKKPLKHLSDEAVEDGINYDQRLMSGSSQVQMLNELIHLIEKELLDKHNKQVQTKLKKLYKLLTTLL